MSKQDNVICKKLRKKIFITGFAGGMAHLASCYSAVEIIYSLYMKDIMKYDPNQPTLPDRDRFILSKGHAGLALFAVMVEAGMLAEDEFDGYLEKNSRIGGEPCMRDIPGIEATTGSLGHGLSMGIGMALGQKLNGYHAKTFVLLGDGECQEGTVWEALLLAPAFHLNNLVVILDANQIQKMDTIENIIGISNWRKRIEPLGWNVKEVDGHDVDAIVSCLKEDNLHENPVFIIAHTVKGKGVSIMEGNPIWHFKLPNRKEKKIFMQELDITEGEMTV